MLSARLNTQLASIFDSLSFLSKFPCLVNSFLSYDVSYFVVIACLLDEKSLTAFFELMLYLNALLVSSKQWLSDQIERIGCKSNLGLSAPEIASLEDGIMIKKNEEEGILVGIISRAMSFSGIIIGLCRKEK